MGYFYQLPPTFVGGAQPYAPPLGLVQSGSVPSQLPAPLNFLPIINQWWQLDPHIVITLPSAAGNQGVIPDRAPDTNRDVLASILRQWDPPQYLPPPKENVASFLLPAVVPSKPPPFSRVLLSEIIQTWTPAPYYPPILQASRPQAQSGITAPLIVTQPVSVTVGVGQTATFCVTASGSLPLTYQWLLNGNPIAGANARCYTTAPEVLANNGQLFSVNVTNIGGSVTSTSALLTVLGLTVGQFFLPDLTGQDWYAASAQIFKLGLVQVFPPIMESSLNYQMDPPGTVVAQYPLAGAIVSPRTNITLTVIMENLLGASFTLDFQL